MHSGDRMDRKPADRLEKADGRSEERNQNRHHQHAGKDEQLPVGQPGADHKNEHARAGDHDRATSDADQHPLHSALENERLQKQRGFKSFAIDGEKTDHDEREPFHRRLLAHFPGLAQLPQLCVPADPINFVEDPIRHHEKHEDRQDRDDGFEFFSITAERLNNCARNPKRQGRGREREPRAGNDAPARVALFRSAHSGEKRGQNDHRFQSFPRRNREHGVDHRGR